MNYKNKLTYKLSSKYLVINIDKINKLNFCNSNSLEEVARENYFIANDEVIDLINK